MKDFILAALPWVVIAVSVAFLCASRAKQQEEGSGNRLTEGMCIGMCLGTAISSTGVISIALGISLGMLAGEIAGLNLKK